MVAFVLALSIAPRQVVTANLHVAQGVTTARLGKADSLALPRSSLPVLSVSNKNGEAGPNVNPSRAPLKQDDPEIEAKLGALYDGKSGKFAEIGGEDLLSRLPSKDVTLAQVGAAIKSSGDLLSANEKLEELGVLKPSEQVDQWGLLRLWHEAAPAQPAPKIDSSWAVPSLTAESRGVTWHVHSVFHGRLIPGMAKQVTALARQLEEKGLPLYTEELLAAFYGLSGGHEVLDRSDGRVVPHHVFNTSPSRLAAAAGSAAMLLWSAWYWGLGLAARLMRKKDLAHWLRARRSALFNGFDLNALRRTELPMPLNSSLDPWVSERSEIIANMAQADAHLNGKTQAHVLVGHKHAQEVLWWLTGGPRA